MVTRRRLCGFTAIAVGTVIFIAGVSVFYLNRREIDSYHQPFPDNLNFGFGFPTSKPFHDFIDPDTVHFKRMFYDGVLVKSQRPTTSGPPQAEVKVFTTVFENPEHCVPFRVPGNLTSRICIYDPGQDLMISSYIRDNAAWELDLVEIMAERMLADDKRTRMEETSKAAFRDTKQKLPDNIRPILVKHLDLDESPLSPVVRQNARNKRSPDSEFSNLQSLQDRTQQAETRKLATVKDNQTSNSKTQDAYPDIDFLLPAKSKNPLTEDSFQQNPVSRFRSTDKRPLADHKHISGDKRPSAEKVEDSLSTDMSLVDIGCNLGVYSLSAAVLGRKVLAIDPVKDSLSLLASSLHLANLTSRATLLLNAISDTRGPVDVNVNQENVGGSSIAHRVLKNESSKSRKVKRPLKGHGKTEASRNKRDTEQVSSKHVRSSAVNSPSKITKQNRGELQTLIQRQVSNTETLPETVHAVCLDDVIPYVRTRRVFLKLDIEGWEAKALRCASTFFQQLDVRYVLMEWLFHRNSRDGLNVIEFLTRNGFLPYEDVRKGTLLDPETYYSWPDNVLWGKR